MEPLGKNNLREGCTLSFVDSIHANEMFGQKMYRLCIIRRPPICITSPAYFNDGNKRTGLAVALTFLVWNGLNQGGCRRRMRTSSCDIASSQDSASTVIDRTALWLESLTND